MIDKIFMVFISGVILLGATLVVGKCSHDIINNAAAQQDAPLTPGRFNLLWEAALTRAYYILFMPDKDLRSPYYTKVLKSLDGFISWDFEAFPNYYQDTVHAEAQRTIDFAISKGAGS